MFKSIKVLLLYLACAVFAGTAFAAPRVVHYIPVGAGPSRAVITPNEREVYVTNGIDNTVSVIATRYLEVSHTVPVGPQPDSIAVSPDGKRVFVGQHGGGISVIQTKDKTVTSIPVGSPVRDIALSPDGSQLLVAMEFGGLKVVDTASFAVSTVNSTVCPEGAVFTPDGAKAFVNYQCAPSPGAGGHDPIYVFDGVTHAFQTAIAFLPDGSRIPNVGNVLSVSPNGQQIWANGGDACIAPGYDHAGCPQVPAGVINVVRTYDNAVIKTLAFPNGAGHTTIAPSSTYAMVGSGANLLLISTSTFQTVKTLPVAASGSVAVTRCGTRGFAPVYGRNAVAVLALPVRL